MSRKGFCRAQGRARAAPLSGGAVLIGWPGAVASQLEIPLFARSGLSWPVRTWPLCFESVARGENINRREVPDLEAPSLASLT